MNQVEQRRIRPEEIDLLRELANHQTPLKHISETMKRGARTVRRIAATNGIDLGYVVRGHDRLGRSAPRSYATWQGKPLDEPPLLVSSQREREFLKAVARESERVFGRKAA